MRVYRSQADLDRHTYLQQVARVTGRVVFGQLWQPDPSLDDILYVAYHPAITQQLNLSSPFADLMDRVRRPKEYPS